jgi:hypothetical protein
MTLVALLFAAAAASDAGGDNRPSAAADAAFSPFARLNSTASTAGSISAASCSTTTAMGTAAAGTSITRARIRNVSIRLSELTKTRVSFDPQNNPIHFVLQLSDPMLFKCPFIMMTEVGAAWTRTRRRTCATIC